jgi:phage recombination protein Bet
MSVATEEKKAMWEDNLDLVKAGISGKISDDDFGKLCYLAKKYDLDPITNEIWATPRKGGHTIMVGRDGMRKAALRSGEYDGMESTFLEIDGDVHCQTKVWKKNASHPFSPAPVPMKEYNSGMSLWRSKPKTMLAKVAEAQALRAAFDLSGLYIAEEFDNEPSMGVDSRNAPQMKGYEEFQKQQETPKQEENKEEKQEPTVDHELLIGRITNAKKLFTSRYHQMQGERKQKFGAELADITKKYTDYEDNPESAKNMIELFEAVAKEFEIK